MSRWLHAEWLRVVAGGPGWALTQAGAGRPRAGLWTHVGRLTADDVHAAAVRGSWVTVWPVVDAAGIEPVDPPDPV